METNEAFSRVKIDAQLRDQGWAVDDVNSVRFEYVLCDRNRLGDVCGRGNRAVQPMARHAPLAPNLVVAMSTFLNDTRRERSQQNK